MRLTKDQEIAGFRADQIRDALRKLREDPVDADNLAWSLDLPDSEGGEILERFVAEGLLEPDERTGRYAMTLFAGGIANASFAKPVRRVVAQKSLDAFLERVAEVNAEPAYVYWVPRVVLFGSMLTNADPVGDVDVAIELIERYHDTGDERVARFKARVRVSGRRFSSFFAELAWPQDEVKLHLKNRDRILSMTTTDDKVLDSAPHRDVYRCEQPARSQ